MTAEMDFPQLRSLGIEACEKYGDIERAAKYLKRRIRSDKALSASLWETMLHTAVLTAIYRARAMVRQGVKKDGRFMPGRCERGIQAANAAMDATGGNMAIRWLFPDGRHLMELTVGEMAAEDANEIALAGGHYQNHRFYEAIVSDCRAKGASDDDKIGETLTGEQIASIWQKITAPKQKSRRVRKTPQAERLPLPTAAK